MASPFLFPRRVSLEIGGASTGPRTREGLARIRKSRTKHGRYTAEMLELRRIIAEKMQLTRALLRELG